MDTGESSPSTAPPRIVKARLKKLDLIALLDSKVQRVASGCWIWTGATTSHGYGHVKIAGRMRSAHRLSYMAHVGAIGEGLQIDHLCRNRRCIAPAHLEAVTAAENTRRGLAPALLAARNAAAAASPLCSVGHQMSGHNFIRRPNGRRACRSCMAARQASYRARERLVIRMLEVQP